jgi:ribosomal protein S27AE
VDWIVAAEECACGRVVFFEDHTLRATCAHCGCSARYSGPFGI